MNDDIMFFPLALPVAIWNKERDKVSGIASFYIDCGYACYVYLFGHESLQHYSSNPDVLLIHSVLQGQNIKNTKAYRIIYDEFYNTHIGFFLKRPNIGNMKDLQNTPIPIGNPKLGSAQLLTTIDGFKPRLYSCVINDIFNEKKFNTSFRICINDMDLVNAVGGGCVGMSGSVIIQNGTIVGVLASGPGYSSNYGFAVSTDQILQKLSEIQKNEIFR